MEQQFETQAASMPVKSQKRFQEYAKKTIIALRRATNTGQDPSTPQHEAPEQEVPSAPDRQPKPDSQQRPRQSVKGQLQQIKEKQAHEQPVARKTREKPQR